MVKSETLRTSSSPCLTCPWWSSGFGRKPLLHHGHVRHGEDDVRRVSLLTIGYYDKDLAYSYPVGVNPDQTVSYDPVNNTLIVTTILGTVTGWSARLLNP